MITIERTRRTLSGEAEFLKFKEFPPFSDDRQDSKAINFGYIFGRSAKSFAKSDIVIHWEESRMDSYIQSNQLEKSLVWCMDTFIDEPDLTRKAICVALDIKKKFFLQYVGFKERIDREISFAKNHGYVRSIYGAVRHLPELFLEGEDDKYLNSMLFSNLRNMAVNTTIQNFEACIVYRCIRQIQKRFKELKLKSRIIGTVHDSIDFYIHRNELEIAGRIVYEEMKRDYLEYKNYPIEGELKYADPLEGGVYKSGKKLKFK